MSLTLNMVGGGGGADVFAFVSATYPSGSTCTASNGVTTLTASDTSGVFVFRIPTPDSTPETWTISCTDGVISTSKTVSITAEAESVSITLRYPFYIVKDGYYANGYSFSNSLRSSPSAVTITEDKNGDGYLEVRQAAEKTGGRVTSLIDLTNYDVIGYDAAFTSTESAAYGTIGAFNGLNKGSANDVVNTQVATFRLSATRQSGTIDISSINASEYIGVLIYTASNSNNKIHQIWNLWLQ